MESDRTVFTPLDMRVLWRMAFRSATVSAVRMANKGLLVRLASGYYALNNRYNRYELANRMLTPSYVSFQAALFLQGINFQGREEIGSVARRDHRRTIGGTLYTYAAMKQELFFNTGGIVTREGVAMALPERAVLDSFYFGFLPDIDDPSKLNKTRLLEWAVFYPRTVQNKAQALL